MPKGKYIRRPSERRALHLENLRKRIVKPPGEASFNALYARYRRIAAERGIDFNLSRDEFRTLTSGDCFYCGAAPAQVFFRSTHNGSYTYNGVDRIENGLGYAVANCVPCCGTCNKMKLDLPLDTFISHVRRIVAIHDARLGRPAE